MSYYFLKSQLPNQLIEISLFFELHSTVLRMLLSIEIGRTTFFVDPVYQICREPHARFIHKCEVVTLYDHRLQNHILCCKQTIKHPNQCDHLSKSPLYLKSNGLYKLYNWILKFEINNLYQQRLPLRLKMAR